MFKSVFRELITRLKHFVPWLPYEERFRFYEVESDKLYRSSQPTPESLSYFVEKYGINSLIILLKHAKDWEFDRALVHKLAVLQIPISSRAPSDDEVKKFIEFVSCRSNQPALVHCAQGRDRSGCFCLIYRVEVMGWNTKDAWREMKKFGYRSLPWHFWMQAQENIERWLEKIHGRDGNNRIANRTPPRKEKHGMTTFSGKIDIFFPWELPDMLAGPAVMFDVVAASHNIANLVSRARNLYVVTRSNVHFALDEIPDALLVGESNDPSLQDKFISSNDALHVANANVNDKTVILITNNGTHTLDEIWSKGARPVIAASYVNIRIVAEWLLKQERFAESITLVPSGGREKFFAATPNLLEDLLCAKSTRKLLLGERPDLEADFILAREFINRYYPKHWPTKKADFSLCFTSSDSYPVVPVCNKLRNGLLQVTRATFS